MKKFLLIFYILFSIISTQAAYISFQPHQITQPDGTIIQCFASGDEFFNFIHDENGYSIIQGNKDAWYYYAIKVNEKIIPSAYRVGAVNPQEINTLSPWTMISQEEYKKRRDAFFAPVKDHTPKVNATGTFNNVVIYIRFAGESEIQTTRQNYDITMNNPSPNSLRSYFSEVSYNNLVISSTNYPSCSSPTTTNASYMDSHPRSYFLPFNDVNNPDGYVDSQDRSTREHQLLVDAINWINANNPVPASLNIDNDNDGNVDNVCFMIKGNSGDWADLLWAHRWMLYSQDVYINGKKVYDYTFQPENQVNWQTLCHEMFHAIGAPDLYHYQNQGVLTPVGNWDLMESGNAHMGAYMKWKYANQSWIPVIPQITTSGQYWIHPLTSNTKNCYKIVSPNSATQFFVVEYRKKIPNTYENNVPTSGLLIYRINNAYNGNADGPPDEVYIYRPYGTNQNDGNMAAAPFSQNTNRTYMSNYTNPASLLANGTNGGLDIFNISEVGDSMSFNINIGTASQYQVTVNSNNSTMGSVTGNGSFAANSSVTVNAIPASGYRFVKWSEIPSFRSSSASYTFSINHNMILTAMFATLDTMCDGGTQAGAALVPTNSWHRASNLNAGRYVAFYVTQGATYTWSLCPSNGGVANYDTQLSVFKFDTDSLIAFNDDGCGNLGHSKIVWTSFFTGKVKVRISEFSCVENALPTTLAYLSDQVAPACDINITADPPESASVTGAGQYNIGEQVIARTIPNTGWYFSGWYVNNLPVHIAYTYVFTAEGPTDLVAKYSLTNNIQDNQLGLINIYYDQNSTSLNFDGDFLSSTKVTIYDVTGRIIERFDITKGITNWSHSAANLCNGIYIIEATNTKQTIRKKIRII